MQSQRCKYSRARNKTKVRNVGETTLGVRSFLVCRLRFAPPRRKEDTCPEAGRELLLSVNVVFGVSHTAQKGQDLIQS